MNAKAEPDVMRSNIGDAARVDKRVYLKTMGFLGRHDARDLLPAVTCPVLILAGEHDNVTPPDTAESMRRCLASE